MLLPTSPRRAASARGHAAGFTLIELMITVAIVAILAALTYPAYTEQIARGRRSDAMSNLLQDSQFMERFYAENYRYDQNTAGTASSTLLPFKVSPPTGTVQYDISLASVSRTAYTLRATRRAGSPMANDKCGNLEYTSLGVKGVQSGSYNASKYTSVDAATLDCWK